MGYLHIDNLYKSQDILMFRECYALEKIDGTSAHVAWKDGAMRFFSGGAKHQHFLGCFDQEALSEAFVKLGHDAVVVYGEAHGGKVQGQSGRYGPALRFAAFDVRVGEAWVSAPNAEDISGKLGLDFVGYVKTPTDIEALNALRDAPSCQSMRNGMGLHSMEGVVLRPLAEMYRSDGKRIIAKHKRDEFRETKTRREVNAETLKILQDADSIAQEWVTEMRLRHVLDKLPPGLGIEGTPEVIRAMVEDVMREGAGEVVDSKPVRRVIGSAAAKLFKRHLRSALEGA